MVSISGIRGVVGESLTPETIVKYGAAFAEYCNHGTIIVGRDGRITGKIAANILVSTLLSAGCDVIAIGIVPTPTVAIAIERFKAAGGISLTASHNPMQWNGLKFMGPDGLFLDAAENKKFWNIADTRTPAYAEWNNLGKHTPDDTMLQYHIDRALSLPYLNKEVIRKRKFKVVADCINSAGGRIVPNLLRELGCEVVELNCDVSGVFARTPEPIPENLGAVCEAIKREKADIGIVVDPDVDRLVLITEKGEPYGEELTVTTAVKFVLEKTARCTPVPQKVVVNLSTTRAVNDVAKAAGATVVRTAVGEINVASKMKQIGAVVGGEGSGGVILTEAHLGRDAIVGIPLILQQIAEFGGMVSEFKATLPHYEIVKSKVELGTGDPDASLARVQAACAGEKCEINTDDGLKIDYADSWVHLRKSNTEPIVRIIAEAPTMEAAQKLCDQAAECFG
jgi:phosphomannomutase